MKCDNQIPKKKKKGKCSRCNKFCNFGFDNGCLDKYNCKFFQHRNIRSMDNMISKNLGKPLDGEDIRELKIPIKELQCVNGMDFKHLFNYRKENHTTS